MEIRTLQYFLTVAQETSFSRAAELLHVTQPTMSRQMAQLEDELGVPLFHRTTRSLSLTREGRLFRRRAEEILALVDRAGQELHFSEQELAGTITIVAGQFENFRILAELMDTFSSLHPKVCYQIYTFTGDIAKEYLEQGLADIAMLMDLPETTQYDYIKLPIAERFEVFMRSDDPMSQLSEIGPEDLNGKTLILPLRRAERTKKWLSSCCDKSSFRFAADFPHNCIALVERRAGYLLALHGAIEGYDHNRFISKPIRNAKGWEIFLAWKSIQPASATVDAFIRHIRDSLGP